MLSAMLSMATALNQFTGYEHTRIKSMLTTIATVSVIVWVLTGLVIAACSTTVIFMSLLGDRRKAIKNKPQGDRSAR